MNYFYKKTNKYKNIRTEIDNIKFQSKKEKDRYIQLKQLQLAGEIKNIVLQPRFVLQDSFEKKGIKYREIAYVADFKYFDIKNNCIIIEDVKSVYTKTPLYLVKKKLFEAKYSDLTITEII